MQGIAYYASFHWITQINTTKNVSNLDLNFAKVIFL